MVGDIARVDLLEGPFEVLEGDGHMMLAVDLDRPCQELLQLALDRGLLINVTAENVIRLLPPLIMTDDEADIVVRELTGAVRAFVEQAMTGAKEQLAPVGGRA